MKVKDLVSASKKWLASLDVTKIHPDPFIQQEAEEALEKLQSILSSLEHSNDPINEYSVKSLLDFFLNRWEFIRGFDAIPMHNLHTPINELTWRIGLALEKELDRNVYSIIASTIKIIRNDPTLEKINYLKPNELVVSDQDDCAIEVYVSIGRYANRKEGKILKHTVVTNGERKHLSEAEKQRVMHHSKKANELYQEADEIVALDLDNEGIKKSRKKATKQNRLENFDDEDHRDYVVTATYGPKAHARFAYKLIPNREKLTKLLLKYPLDKWDQILNVFNQQDLRAMLLNGTDYKVAAVNKDIYTKSEEENRTILVMYLHLLRRDYKECKEAYTGSSWGWKKEIKENESDISYNYLLSGQPLAGFNQHLKTVTHTNALVTGKLGAVTNHISAVAEYSKPQELQKTWSLRSLLG